jgi:hypothetical protein
MVFEPICRFAEVLRLLLQSQDSSSFERVWKDQSPSTIGWDALTMAWRRDSRGWESALAEVDGLLLSVLDRLDGIVEVGGTAAERINVFRRAELERLQHATAAGLVALRFGTAGLQTVVEDRRAPKARRYFAMVAAADRHAPNLWSLFQRHLKPGIHHAFQAAAAEAVRFYPEQRPTELLVQLFDSVRNDENLRAFLSPRILESMFVLNDPAALPFWRGLLVSGYTHADLEWCEVTRASVMIRRLTGQIEPNTKFGDDRGDGVFLVLDRAERLYRQLAPELRPVTVI